MGNLTVEQICNGTLDQLKDWAIEAYESEENKARQNDKKQRKFIIYIGRSVYAKLFGFTMQDFFTDAKKSLEAQLRTKLFVYYILKEDTPFNLSVGIDLGTALEATLFGMDYIVTEAADPTYGAEPVFKQLEDYKRLEYPDFYTSGWMPEAHRLYEQLKELAEDPFQVYFPGWARGPWSMATILRGFNHIFEDYLDDPEEVGEMLKYLSQARIAFEKQRLKFLGLTPQDDSYRWTYCSYRYNHNSDIFEDEVDGSLFSAKLNRELIIPAQKMLADFYGGPAYYHSCGDLGNFLEDIASLHIRKYQHISPATWKSYDRLNQLWAPEVIAQISLKTTDVMNIHDTHEMEKVLTPLMTGLKGRRAEICADALFEGGWDLIENVTRWRDVFRRLDETLPEG